MQGFADAVAATVPVVLVRHEAPRGFTAACNAGLARARGEWLVLLNSDAVVTDAWLDQLGALATSRPEVGLAGPMSNCGGPPQLVVAVPYPDLDGMEALARW